MFTYSADATELRARGWRLLSALAARGATPDLLPTLRAIPALAAHLPHPFDADQAAALHYHVFGLTLPGGQGLFLEEEPLSGVEMARLRPLYAEAGIRLPPDGDSLAAETALLATLCSVENPLDARLLDAHLLRWLPPLCEGLARGPAFYAAFAALLADVAADHVAALQLPPTPWQLPAPSALLDDPATRLDDIIPRLLRPAYAGFLLDRDSLRILGRATSLPAPFGDRASTLRSLFQSAGAYDALPDLLAALHARVAEAAHAYCTLAADLPILAPWIAPWQTQSAATLNLLDRMRILSL